MADTLLTSPAPEAPARDVVRKQPAPLAAVFVGLCALLVGFHAYRFWTVYRELGLFHRLGFDWALFWAQAHALGAGATSALYDTDALQAHLDLVKPYTADPTRGLAQWPVPYPPVFAALHVPFTLPEPPLGFALWLAVNLLGAAFLAYRVRQLLPGLGVGALVAVLAPVPVAWALFLGQPAVLLAIALGECFVSLRSGRDARAGLWLAVLFLKPQYAVVFCLLFLVQRRWRALAGVAFGGIGIALLSVAIAGWNGSLAFVGALGGMADFRNEFAGPAVMINWRSILLGLEPSIPDTTGLALVGALSVVTIGLALTAWRGRWSPASPTFSTGFLLITLSTLLAAYHSHLHGAALLCIPVAAAFADRGLSARTRWLLLVAGLLPSVMLAWQVVVEERFVLPRNDDPLWLMWPGILPAGLVLACAASVWLDLWPRGRAGLE